MFTVTFYSYKGGVGRTMALANTAHRLSDKGKKVFVLDFDLEAPGLDLFLSPNEVGPGIVEYIGEYADTGNVPDLHRFVYTVPSPSKKHVYPIHCMRAGKGDERYQLLLAQLNWKEFYAQRHGFLLVENLKRAIEAEFSPDYLLVDSRTGLTDVSGICTLQLPNLVVFLFGLNDQNLMGTARIYKSVIQNKLNRAIDALLVASPVPEVPDYVSIKEERLAKAREYLGRDIDLSLPYAAFVAFQETVLSAKTPGVYLARQYDELCDRILDCNKSDVLTVLKDLRKVRAQGDPERALAKYQEIIQAFPTAPEVWRHYGLYLRSIRRFEEAAEAFVKAVEFGGPASNQAELALTLSSLGRPSAAEEAFSAYAARSVDAAHIANFADLFSSRGANKAAIVGYERVVQLSDDSNPIEAIHALVGLGHIYMRMGQTQAASSFYRRVIDLQPNSIVATYCLADALLRSKDPEAARTLFKRATEIYAQSHLPVRIPGRTAQISQAMGRAYLFLGDVEQARKNIESALMALEKVNTPVFSFIRYADVSPEEFRSETEQLLRELGVMRQA